MKKFASINMVNYGSTGKIMLEIAEVLRENGYEGTTFSTNLFSFHYSKPKKTGEFHKFYGSYFDSFFHFVKAHLTGVNGKGSYFATKRLVKTLKKIKPDIIHLHNLHNYCINLKVLFNYVKKENIPVVWTLHDCWTFTGHCPHFEFNGCEKYLSGCGNCKYYKEYPKVYKDGSKKEFEYKKRCYDGAKITFVCTSEWVTNFARKSFIKDFDIKTIKNGIDLTKFKPIETEEKLKIKEKYGIDKDKFILLGVSMGWTEKKGIDVIKTLSETLDENLYQIVLVGAGEDVKTYLNGKVICIKETFNREELSKIYSSCDLFINPTREDTYPTVNMEAISSGTPIVSFNTGGSPEIYDDKTGLTTKENTAESMKEAIEYVKENKPFKKEDLLNRAKTFDKNINYQKYVELFNEITKNS